MKLKIFITVILLNILASAQTIFWDYSKKLHGKSSSTIVVPVFKIPKNDSFVIGLFCKDNDPKFNKYFVIKTKIWQENPCLVINPNEVNYKVLNKHTAVITLKKGEKFYSVGDEWEILPEQDSIEPPYKLLLGDKKCKLKGKEKWTIYYLDKGKWKYGCSGTFIYK